jgi:amino acid adenylation domain-containing protein
MAMNVTLESIASSARPARTPLSYSQQRLWFLDQLQGESTEYHLVTALRLRGDLDRVALERALATIVARHESLRTSIVVDDGEPRQVVDPAARVSIQVQDLSDTAEELQSERVSRAVDDERDVPFDLGRAPLFRTRLLRLAEREHVFIWTFHHIVSDGWSLGVFHRELSTLYEAFRQGRENPLPPLPAQYADFALWQRQRLTESRLQAELAYWATQLAGMPERLTLPTDRPRPERQTFVAGRCSLVVSSDLLGRVKKLGRRHGASVFMTFVGAFAVLLSRYSGQDDIAIGSPIANRQHRSLEPLIGFFVNKLVMRVRVPSTASFHELIKQVARTAIGAYEHQDVPFERLVEELAPTRTLAATPLFQVGFAMQNAVGDVPQLAGLDVELVQGEDFRVRLDMELHARERANGDLVIHWLYNVDLFDQWRVEQMARQYVRVLDSMTADGDAICAQVDLLGAEERQQTLVSWNDTGQPHGEARLLHELVAQRAAHSPDHVVLVHADQQVTYGALERRASELAGYLRRIIGDEGRVALSLDRSVDMVVAVLAVMKAGGVYVPLHPSSPAQRQAQVIADSGASVVLTHKAIAHTLPVDVPVTICLDADWQRISGAQPPPVPPDPASSRAAYVIYTSGTTGGPKGVVVEHRQVLNYVEAIITCLDLGPAVRYGMVQPLAVDSSVTVLYAALVTGGRLYLVDETTALDARLYADYNRRHGIECLKIAPSHLTAIMDDDGAAPLPLRWLVLGGEASRRELVEGVLARGTCRVFNHYGPTETTVGVLVSALRAEPRTSVPIGRPIANVRAYIVDQRLQPSPIGVPGALLIGGECVSRGYLNRPVATATGFVADPFGPPGARLYRTGDLARWRPDGQIEFLGRSDDQVKIRGFRVEPGEIETMLRRDPRVRDALVTVHDDDGSTRLCAYVLRESTEAEDSAARLEQLRDWQEMYESHSRSDVELGDFNIVGWNSSYTGAPIPETEMRIWVEETVARLRALAPRRVLEIGCGTGLLLTRLAPECESYLGTDFSARVVDQLARYLTRRADLRHVELRHGLAHDLGFMADGAVDLVIINSVAQYFPDVGYLLDVLSEAVRVTRRGGHLFIGDVRNLQLAPAYHASVQMSTAAADLSVRELRARVARAERNEEELLVDPQLFEELARRWPGIGRADVALKAGAYDNEVSRFRYDVTLRLGDKETAAGPDTWVPWDEAGRWRRVVEARLNTDPGSSVGVRGVADKRAAFSVAAAQWLERAEDRDTVGALPAALGPLPGEDPNDVIELGRQCGAAVSWRGFSADAVYAVVFNAGWQPAAVQPEMPRAFYRRFTNTPARRLADSDLGRALQDSLRDSLRDSLPDYMVPSSIVVLHSWPLTRHGKIDRRALPLPDAPRGVEARPARDFEEEVLCRLFASVLGVERVGVDDDFFALGGHSLLATRLVSRVRATLQVELPLRALFEAPTVRALVQHVRTADVGRPPLGPRPRPARLPLSHAQERLWFIDQLEGGGSTNYNVVGAQTLRGDLDCDALERAIAAIVDRHEALRTRFLTRHGDPEQIIDAAVPVTLPVEDCRELPDTEQRERVRVVVRGQFEEPFDLASGPLFRARLMRLGLREHVLILAFHHIVTDGWSQTVFSRELLALYDAFHERRLHALPPLPLQYADFALWQRDWLDERRMAEGLAYWTTHLAGMPERLALPTDFPRAARRAYAGDRCPMVIPRERLAALDRLNREHETTLYMTLLAAFGVLLWRHSQQNDIIVGSPIANRQDTQLEDLIGFFVNTLLMRVRLEPDMTVAALLAHVRRTTLDAYRYQDVPFNRLVEELAPQRTLNATPLFQVMLLVHNVPWQERRLTGLEVSPLAGDGHHVHFDDLELHVRERGGELTCSWIYDRDLFGRWRIEQMSRHYERILGAMIGGAERRLCDIDLLTRQERLQILEEWDRGRHAYREGTGFWAHTLPRPVVDCLQAVEQHADRIAIQCGARSLSYDHLHTRSAGIARALARCDSDLVGILAADRMELPVAILGVLKAGRGFVPLDPLLPIERVRALAAAADLEIVLTDRQSRDVFENMPLRTVLLDECGNDADLTPAAWQDDVPCWVYFTSGSTGVPKGVVGRMRALEHHLWWVMREAAATEQVRGSQLIRPSFSAYLRDLFLPLCAGGTLFIPPDPDVIGDGRRLAAWLRDASIEVMSCTPTVLRALLDGGRLDELRSLRCVMLTGEPLWPVDVRRWLDTLGGHARLVNLYGATETNLAKLGHVVTERDASRSCVAIGKPMPGVAALIVDSRGEPCAPGTLGEIVIWTPFLSFGYYADPELTAQKFVRDEQGCVVYRTGDIGRLANDGVFEYIGRRDGQVKIRGNRIELGEIEAVLLELEGVEQATVTVHDHDGELRLVAYVEGTADSYRLRRSLMNRLPAVMVPSAIMCLAKLPLTASGKIDRTALPAPTYATAAARRAPQTARERLLCAVFADVLGVPDVGSDDDFFELGGHSLMAMRLVSRIRSALGVEFSMQELFDSPTMASVAARLSELSCPDFTDMVVPLRPGGNLPGLFCLHAGDGEGWEYAGLMRHLTSDHSLYVVRCRAPESADALSAPLPATVRDCVAGIRQVQATGPYHLLGTAASAVLVYELANELQQRGHETGLVALVNSHPGQEGVPDDAARVYHGDLLLVAAGAGIADAPRLARTWRPYVTGQIRLHYADHEGGPDDPMAWGREIGTILASQFSSFGVAPLTADGHVPR